VRVGFIGLGNQGAPIARRIIDAGYPTTLWARREATLAPFAGTGARAAATPAALAADSDLIGICVVDDADVTAVVTGETGLLAGAAAGTIIAVHSTVHPDTCRMLAERAAERGAVLIDAPVSGSVAAAEAGTLLVMVGGSAETAERCRPVFATFGDPVLHVGPIGSAQLAKVVNNAVFAANMAVARDGVELGTALGISGDIMVEVLAHGSARSFALSSMVASLQAVAAGGNRGGFLLRKDLDILTGVAGQAGADAGPLVAVGDKILITLGYPPGRPGARPPAG
jgi:3-hydroxyisobutyrate dehydrogenase-like beta-hydroxyacid dehydrogenase